MAFWKRRRIFWVLLIAALGVLVAVAAMPLWFPWILRPVAKRLGASYGRYEHEGYQRFRLTDVVFTNRSGHFEAKQVEAFLPMIWLWRCLDGQKSAPFLEADSWNWSAAANPARPPASSAYQILETAGGKIGALEKWLPKAQLTNGTLRLKGQILRVPQAVWAGGKLSAQLASPRLGQAIHLQAAVESLTPPKLNVNLDAAALQFQSQFTIAAVQHQVNVEGTALWLSNRIVLTASLAAHGFVPQTASLQADSFQIPAGLLKLKHYSDLTGDLKADWNTNRFTLNLSARSLPRSANWSPIRIEAAVSGNTNAAQIDLARVSTPWLDARLSRKTEILFKPPFLTQPAALDVTANLARQSWFPAKGDLAGEAVLRPGAARFPEVSLTLDGAGLSLSNFTAKTLRLQGGIQWPQLELTRGNMELADGSTISLTGGFNVQKQTVQDGRLRFSGGFGRRFLPSAISFRTASVAARFAGPLRALTNSGTLRVEGFQIPHARPLRMDASWQGRGLNLQQMQVALSAGDASLQMHGAARLAESEKTLDVSAFTLSRGNRAELQLQEPFEVAFKRNKAGSSNLWSLALQPVNWSGNGSGLKLAAAASWPQTGTFQISARNLNAGLIQDFLNGGAPAAELNHLTFSAGWTNSAVAFQLDALAGWKAGNGLAFGVNAQVSGGTNGIAISQLSISSETQTVCHAEGILPVTFDPERTNGFIQINPDGPVRLQASTQTNSILWREIADASGLLLVTPRLEANLNGTWTAPRGQITLRAQRIRFPQVKHALPELENIDLAAEVNHDEAQISRFHFLLAGQPVQFTAQMPFQKAFWSTLMSQRRLPDWREATAHLKIENAELAPFAKLMPEMLSPQGALRADLTLQSGGVLKGALTVTNAATLPLTTLGAVRNIQFTVKFTGQAAELTNFSALIGGEPVTANGRMPLNIQEFNGKGLPPFMIRLRGTNVPLVRKPSLLLRADLALTLTNPPSGPGMVTGSLTLRDSLFLASLQSLIPENTATPAQHPPYFSVAAQPWAGWHLDLQVNGNQFMRVQTPVFHGKASTTMKLQGTLGNPLALGEVKIASGVITFPFGNLSVDQGFISLTTDNPYHPRLFITAQAQQFGYNVKLEVTGTVDAPVVQFSSTPPLTSQEIVLMLTTGQLPTGIGVSTSTQQRAQGLAMFFGKNLLSEFGLGLGDQNRLTVRSGQQISEAGRPTYEADYQISKRWSLVGQYDQFDQYDLNLKWNIYSK